MTDAARIALQAKPFRFIPAAWFAAAEIAVMFMGSTLLTPLYVLYQREHGFSQLTLTVVYAAYVIGNVTALFLLGRLSDQVGRRRASLPAIALAAVATAVFMLDAGTMTLFAGRVLSGLAIGVASGTGTAWVVELTPDRSKSRASVLATAGNFAGLALGPLVAGMLARYAPWPMELSYIVYLVLLALLAFVIAATPETVERRVRQIEDLSLRPRIGVPRAIRSQFLAPAVTAFATFALIGYYAALLPSLMGEELGERSPAIGGLVVSGLFVAAMVTVAATRSLAPRTAMLSGLALLPPSLALLVAAEIQASMPTLIAATMLAGVASALGYRGSLQVVNAIAPNDRRAEVLSAYLLTCYLANSLPIIGVGVLSRISSLPVASYVFAATIVFLAAAAFAVGVKYRPPPPRA
jgi:predicted MFS family arabinose efflux permease